MTLRRVHQRSQGPWAPRVSRRACMFGIALALGFVGAGCGRSEAQQSEVTIAAAASLRGVMPELVRRYQTANPGVKVSVTYGASGDLRKQIEGGAPIDGMVFASGKPVDDLVQKGLVEGTSRVVLAHNRLVLIGPRGGPKLTFATLDQAPSGEKIAMGDPGPVPAGQYAKEALVALGKWEILQPRLVFGGDVGAVLKYARQGEVAAAIVYETEARDVSDVVVLDRGEAPWAPAPEVVAAVVSGSPRVGLAGEFVLYLRDAEAQSILRENGFGP